MRQRPPRPAPITVIRTFSVAVAVVGAVAVSACSSGRPLPEGSPGATATTTATTSAAPTLATASASIAPPGSYPPTSSVASDGATPDDSVGNDTVRDGSTVVPEGFGRVAARAVTADGEVCELCLWLADDADRRSRGLMFVTDLGPADGMAFRYDRPTSGSFWMRDTILPLSIAFFSADGQHLGAFDMEPCTTPSCPRYPTPDDFLVAVEVERGRLGQLGLGAGSTLELLDQPCP